VIWSTGSSFRSAVLRIASGLGASYQNILYPGKRRGQGRCDVIAQSQNGRIHSDGLRVGRRLQTY